MKDQVDITCARFINLSQVFVLFWPFNLMSKNKLLNILVNAEDVIGKRKKTMTIKYSWR